MVASRFGEKGVSHILAPTQKRALGEDVAERLREAIIRGHFAPGQPLREEQLAALLDVSRGPVRQALTQLEREGLVIIRHHRGATVARLSRADLEEVYSLRLAIERLAIQYAIRQARPEDLAAMEAVIQEWRKAAANGITEPEVADFDVRFHELIYRAARHQRLLDCWLNLRSQNYVFLLSRNVARPDSRLANMASAHGEILQALRDRDERRAINIINEHVTSAYVLVVKSYNEERPGDGPPPLLTLTDLSVVDRAPIRPRAKVPPGEGVISNGD